MRQHNPIPRSVPISSRLCRVLFGAWMLGFSLAMHAAQYCVSSETAFFSALLNASASAEDDEIRLVKGAIQVNVDLGASGKISGDLALRGGYDEGCTTRVSAATTTRLNSQAKDFRLFPRQASDLLVERVEFDGFKSVSVVDNVAEPAGPYGLVLIVRSAFRNAQMGLTISLLRHDVRIENSVFVNNNALPYSRGLLLETFHNPGTGQDPIVSVINCTMRNNSVGLTVGVGSAGAATPASLIANSIVSDNAIVDVELFRPAELRYNLYGTLGVQPSGALTPSSGNNLRAPALLDGNHRPLPGSRAINSGDNSYFPVPLKARDHYGNPRIANSAVDRGAVESSF